MGRKIAYQNGNISSLTCYNVEASNPGCFSTTVLSLSSTRTIALTYANSGSALGVVLMLYSGSHTTRGVTVNLQENVASVWTTRAFKTLNANEISNSQTNNFGTYTIDFIFTSSYAVDTASNKWRLEVSQGSGTNNWALLTSNGTVPFYEAWCDNTSTFTSASDSLGILTDIDVTVDGSFALLGTLGTGDTTRAICGYSCRSTNTSKTGMHGLICDSPSSAYTITLNGVWVNNGFSPSLGRFGMNGEISIANQLKIIMKAPTNGTSSRIQPATMDWTAPAVGKTALLMNGASRSIDSIELSSSASSGQPTISVASDPTSSWSNGDICWLDFSSTIGASNNYVISSMTSSTITFTTNLSKAYTTDAKVYNIMKGIRIESDSSTVRTMSVGQTGHSDYRGVSHKDVKLQISISNQNQQISSFMNTSDRSAWIWEDIDYDFTTTTSFIEDGNSGDDGFTITRLVGNLGCWNRLFYPVRTISVKRLEIYYSVMIAPNTRASFGNQLVWNIENCRFCGGTVNTNAFTLGGTDFVFKNNYIYNFTGALGGFATTNVLTDSRDWSNNTWDNCTVSLAIVDTGLISNLVMDSDQFIGSRITDLYIYAGSNIKMKLRNINSITSNISTVQSLLSPGSEIVFENYAGTEYNNFLWKQGGNISYTGSGLSDTTVRTAGTHNLRLEAINESEGIYIDFLINSIPDRNVVVNGFLTKNALMQNEDVIVELYLPGLVPGIDTPSSTYTIPNTTDVEPFAVFALYEGTIGAFSTLRIVAKTTTSGAYVYLSDIYNGTNEITNFNTYKNGKPSPVMFEQLGDAQAVAQAVWAYATSNAEFEDSTKIGGLTRNNIVLIPAIV